MDKATGATLYICAGSYGGFGVRKTNTEIRITLGWVSICLLFLDIEQHLKNLGQYSVFSIMDTMHKRNADYWTCTMKEAGAYDDADFAFVAGRNDLGDELLEVVESHGLPSETVDEFDFRKEGTDE